MNNFQIAWLVAGAIIGWFGLDVAVKTVQPRLHIPFLFNLAFAFVGGLIAYTIVR